MTAKLTFKTDTAAATPASGYVALYAKTDGKVYFKDDVGVEHSVEGTTGAAGPAGRDFSGSLACSVAGNALTIAIKDGAGADPSGGSPVIARFRNVTATSGVYTELSITAATSFVVSSGSTLGSVSSVPFRGWIVAFNDAGTLRIGVINCLSSVAGAGAGRDVTAIFPLAGWGIASSVAEGGAGAADSAQVFYTGTAVTSKAYIVLGYFTYETALGTAGTYASAPGRVQLFTPGTMLPGQVVQVLRNETGAVATGTTTIPHDDTIPQNTEGDQYMSQAITPSSAANVLDVESITDFSMNAAPSNTITVGLFRDSTANAVTVVENNAAVTSGQYTYPMYKRVTAEGSASTTFKLRAGCSGAGTTTFNGNTSARLYGGVYNSFLEVREIMA